MKPFRERNQTMIGVIGIVVIVVMMVAAFKADKLPIIGAGDIYYADFSEVGGLHAGNEVRVAGVAVGNVDEIELEGDHVKVTFKSRPGPATWRPARTFPTRAPTSPTTSLMRSRN
jgi:phospholipid/cholesterol/gamma-HCH transport system substrate-binding protein